MRFKVLSVTGINRWWSRFSGTKRIVMQIVHDDPNDWLLDGILKFHVKDPDEAAEFAAGQVYRIDLTKEV